MSTGPGHAPDVLQKSGQENRAWLIDSVVQLADTLSPEVTLRDVGMGLAYRLADLLPGWDAAVLVRSSRGNLHLAAASNPKLALLEQFELAHDQGPATSGLRDEPAPFGIELARRSEWRPFATRARAAGYTVVHTLPLARHHEVAGIATIFGAGRELLPDGLLVDARRLVDAAAIGILARQRVDQSEELASHLQHALDSRVIIERAKGALVERIGVPSPVAFELMRARARSTNTKLEAVAESVIERRWSPPAPKVARGQIAAGSSHGPGREPRPQPTPDQPPSRAEQVDDLPVALIAVRPDLSAAYTNLAWREISRQEAAHGADDEWLQRIHPKHRGEVVTAVRTAYARGGDTLSYTWEILRPDGDSRWVEARVRQVRRDDHRGAVLVSLVDVTDRHADLTRRPREPVLDPLTGLPRGDVLTARLTHALTRLERRETTLAVLLVGLDDLESVNDARGLAAGDEVLAELSRRFRNAVRPADTVARVGGDAFAVLCEDLEDPAQALEVAGRLVTAAQRPVDRSGEPVRPGVSVGVTVAAGPRDSVEELLARADRAMSEAKRGGRDRVALVEPAPSAAPVKGARGRSSPLTP